MSERVLYLEPIGGIAGDMFLAAALDLGVDLAALEHALSGLQVEPYALKRSSAVRHAIGGTHVDVVLSTTPELHAHRALSDIRKLIEDAPTLSVRAKERALAVFQVIGEAEAHIHQVPIEQIHFHEVGAVDSIVDICGAAVVLELLGNPRVYSAPPPLGSGVISAAHGRIPIPAPATLEILKDVPVKFEGVGELTTPTGAALLKALAQVAPPPSMEIERIGYGLGTKDFADRANVLRASLGRVSASVAQSMWEVSANIDDCTPQLLGALMEQLLAVGAVEAFVAPVVMKKSRPGHVLTALVSGETKERVIQSILSESTTLGVRVTPVERVMLDRRWETVTTRWGPVRVKVGIQNGKILNVYPEFEDCRHVALAHHVALKTVMAEAMALFHQSRTDLLAGGQGNS